LLGALRGPPSPTPLPGGYGPDLSKLGPLWRCRQLRARSAAVNQRDLKFVHVR
jgi:hypothetical protein